MWNDGMMQGWMWGGWLLGLVFTVLVLVVLVLLILWLLRQLRGDGGHGPDAHEILRRRYVRGDLSREEVERLRREIE